MKTPVTFLTCCVLMIVAACGDGNSRRESTTATATAAAPDTTAPRYYYKRFEGTIAGKPVVLHLHKTNDGYEAIYYYLHVGQWLTLNVDSVAGDTVIFSEYPSGAAYFNNDAAATLHLALSDHTAKGSWHSADGRKQFAVALQEQYPAGSEQFDTHYYFDSLVAFPSVKESPVATSSCYALEAHDNAWLNTQLHKMLDFSPDQSLAEGFKQWTSKYFEEYRSGLPEAPDSVEFMNSWSWGITRQLFVRYNEGNLLVLEQDGWDYSGGAHGNFGSSFACLDLEAKKQLALSDLLTADSATLQPIVEKYFVQQYELAGKPLTELLFDEHLALTENFYITGAGIGFLYNPYEVAAYAVGQINVFVPFTALRPYLTPWARQRMHLQ